MLQEEYSYWLANLPKIGVKKIELLLQIFYSSEGVFRATRKELDLLKREGLLPDWFSYYDVDTILNNREVGLIQENYAKLVQNGISFISKESSTYPEKLRNIYEAPYAVYVRGRLPQDGEKLLAVVGARECTPYGREMARYLSGEVAKKGIAVISGLAKGIDSYAHEGVLFAAGVTYGVLGCGIDICYPKENIRLYMEMQQRGGIISEYAPGVKPFASHFPMRNRMISALSDGILVVEAKAKSGSLITVDYGLEHGKEIYALPGRTTDRFSEGCNNLIKMGAKLVSSPKDILEDFIPGFNEYNQDAVIDTASMNETERLILTYLNSNPMHIEELSMLTGKPLDSLMEELLSLELRGTIRQEMKNYYCRPQL
jgi:DNA processing protein